MESYKEYLIRQLMLEESTGIVFTFGRMNPFTKGHEENINELIKIAKQNKMTPVLYLSASNDNKKNPLTFKEKVYFANKCLKKDNLEISKNNKLNNPYKILEDLSKTYKKIYFVVGEDRIKDFSSLQKYADEYNVDFKLIQSGTRKQGISGTKMREYAMNDNFEDFYKNVPSKCKKEDALLMFNKVKKVLK